jgi:ribosomal protein S18 acetylase RimI-like enzyme
MTTISIRRAILADLADLAVLFDRYRRFYGRAGDRDGASAFLQARLQHADSTIFIAFDGACPVGFVQLYPSFSSLSLARVFILNDLFVEEHCRKNGAGTALIAAARAYATSLGARYLTLSTAKDNATAQALYRATGWKRDEQFDEYSLALAT